VDRVEFLTWNALGALGSVLLVDLVLAGDNAIVVGMAAAGLPRQQRTKAILFGIILATAFRIGFAAITVQLLAIVGLTLAGGILLTWVAWKFYRELRQQGAEASHIGADPASEPTQKPTKTMTQALIAITVADVSMSLDNVLAVAGAAGEHLWVLIVGLVFSVGLTGLASSLIAALLSRHRWVAYVGLAVILYVALDMIWRGTHEVLAVVG
jgi:YjbE family integral membrane protein